MCRMLVFDGSKSKDAARGFGLEAETDKTDRIGITGSVSTVLLETRCGADV
jgi:hypothetical protein